MGDNMKLLFISDIHGIKTNLEKIKERFEELKCDKLVVLGDLFYARLADKKNGEYDIEYVRNFLNSFKDKIICVQGNCDSAVDKMICEFPIISELGVIATIKDDIYITHGHIYNESNWYKTNSILIYGHSHVPFIKKIESNLYINPGSISLPKDNKNASYLFYDEDEFIIYDINDNIIDKLKI